MAVKLRLTRFGTHKRPFYRLVATDPRFPQGGRHLEILGTFDPKNLALPKDSKERDEKGLTHFKSDRIIHWLNHGAQTSVTVANLLKRLKISRSTPSKAA